MRLRAEMKVPGQAWLQFRAEKIDDNRTRLLQTALFDPKGLYGFFYWYMLYPIHGFIFGSMIRKLKEMAEQEVSAAAPLAAKQQPHLKPNSKG